MSEGSSVSFESSGKTSGCLPVTKIPRQIHVGSTEMVQDENQPVAQPPIQEILRSPKPNFSKHNRGSSRRKASQGSKPSARHIEEAAGDASDLTASLLLACLFCQFSDCLLLLPGTCSLGLNCLCCSSSSLSCGCLSALSELCCCQLPSSCNSIDCGFFDLCQHTDSCALCLLAGLFCEASILCSALLGCVSCGLCSDGALCGSVCPDWLCCSSAESVPCDPGCVMVSEGCRSSDCLDICLECCSLCFPS